MIINFPLHTIWVWGNKMGQIKQAVYYSEFEEILEKIGMKNSEARKVIGISFSQNQRWKKKGKIPLEYFSAFQQAIQTFIEKESLRKKVQLKLIEKEFLLELIREIEENEL